MGHDKGHAALTQKLFISASASLKKEGVPLGLIPQKSSQQNRITIRRRQHKKKTINLSKKLG